MLVLKKMSADKFIVWCEAECVLRVLDAAQRVGLAGARYAFLLLAPDLRAASLQPYSHGGANVTALRLFDPAAPDVQRFMGAWREEYARLAPEDAPDEAELQATQQEPPTALLLARDAAVLATRALLELALPPLATADCAAGRGAFHADTLLNYLRSVSFCIELIERLATILQFNYTFIEQEDGQYGSKQDDGTWNGMIGRLHTDMEDGQYGSKQPNGEWNGMIGCLHTDMSVEFAITDLTITAEREQAVDFTTPFMNLGISILFRKPEPPEPQLFAFLLPFSNGVWLCLGLAYLGSSLLLYVVGRLCHEEWQNPYPCIEEPPALENQFTLGNALWFNLGAVLLQGSEIAPVAYGTRAVASAWWVFALVITSSYTANLATLLAKPSTTELIHNVEELANSPLHIDYGAKEHGSTYTFFEVEPRSTLWPVCGVVSLMS
ncbi:Ionotropic glutamate receptor subunit ia [Operophtera brumata]|uniref:Ionotropic glutamate receptor subunit ia n=1 Tax=Operophtera brumata TaxID=104452 RepID=A0A0L7L4H7_OPEBR|nr:Ionotropic glutamate receptor subunit ia [Operophtera brumata]